MVYSERLFSTFSTRVDKKKKKNRLEKALEKVNVLKQEFELDIFVCCYVFVCVSFNCDQQEFI